MPLTVEGFETEDGWLYERPESDGAIRCRDEHGNTVDVIRPEHQDWAFFAREYFGLDGVSDLFCDLAGPVRTAGRIIDWRTRSSLIGELIATAAIGGCRIARADAEDEIMYLDPVACNPDDLEIQAVAQLAVWVAAKPGRELMGSDKEILAAAAADRAFTKRALAWLTEQGKLTPTPLT